MAKRYIYADHAATTRLDSGALEAMLPFLGNSFCNPSSFHFFGRCAKEALDAARSQIATCIGAQPDEIFFTSGGTESDNWAIKGIAESRSIVGKHIITSAIEHHAVIETCHYLTQHDYKVTFLHPNEKGHIDSKKLQAAICPDTSIISIMLANNEIGTIEDIPDLVTIAQSHRIPFHTDAVQAVGHIPTDVQKLGVDSLSASAHKFNGPKGIGFLYLRKGCNITNFMDGGQQELGYRAGTENVASIVGMAVALKDHCDYMNTNIIKLRRMEHTFRELIEREIPSIIFNGDEHNHLPGHISISIPDISSEAMLHILDMRGIAISSGAACNSQSMEISHVLQAIGLSESLAKGTLRISFGPDNNEEDVIIVSQEILCCYRRIT